MAKCVVPGQLMIKDENLGLNPKKAALNGKTKNPKTVGKKDGAGRKALNDITNKTSLHPDTSSRKKNLPKEEVNVKEEMFLHDHKKCIEAQKAATRAFNLEMVLPQNDSISILEDCESEQRKVDSPRCYPEPVELPMSEFSDWLDSSMQWSSPPSSPFQWDHLLSPFDWHDEEVQFTLKEDDQREPTI